MLRTKFILSFLMCSARLSIITLSASVLYQVGIYTLFKGQY